MQNKCTLLIFILILSGCSKNKKDESNDLLHSQMKIPKGKWDIHELKSGTKNEFNVTTETINHDGILFYKVEGYADSDVAGFLIQESKKSPVNAAISWLMRKQGEFDTESNLVIRAEDEGLYLGTDTNAIEETALLRKLN